MYCIVNTALSERDIFVCLASVLYRNSVFSHIAIRLHIYGLFTTPSVI